MSEKRQRDSLDWLARQRDRIKKSAIEGNTKIIGTNVGKASGESGGSSIKVVIISKRTPRDGKEKPGSRPRYSVKFLNPESINIRKKTFMGKGPDGKRSLYEWSDSSLPPFTSGLINIPDSPGARKLKPGQIIEVFGITRVNFQNMDVFDTAGIKPLQRDNDLIFKQDHACFYKSERDFELVDNNQTVIPITNEKDIGKEFSNGSKFVAYISSGIESDKLSLKSMTGEMEICLRDVDITGIFAPDETNNKDSELMFIKMPIYKNSILNLGISTLSTWLTFGKTFCESWRGVLYGFKNWSETEGLLVNQTDDEQYKSGVSVRGEIIWDMQTTIKNAGFKISPEYARELDGQITVDHTICMENVLARDLTIGALNFNEYNGDKTKLFNSPDWEFYIILNVSRKDVDFVKSKPYDDTIFRQILKEEDDLRLRFTGDPSFLLFALKKTD